MANKESKNNRKGYEFSQRTKNEVYRRQKGCCASCGKHESVAGRLEYHHRLGIYIAKKQYPHIHRDIIKSPHNCIALCNHCHKEADINSWEDAPVVAAALLRVLANTKALV